MFDYGRGINITNVNAPTGGSGNPYPDIVDELEYAPRIALQEAFVAARPSLITFDSGTFKISALRGLLGAIAAQSDAAKQPIYSATAISGLYPGITGDGVDDVLLNTGVPMPASGYMVVAFQQPASPAANAAHCGAFVDATNRCYLGHRTNAGNVFLAAAIGSLTQNALSGTTPLVVGNVYIGGLQWDVALGTAKLRLNGIQEASGSFTGTAGVTKNMAIGAYASGAAGALYSKAAMTPPWVFAGDSTVITNAFMAEADAAHGLLVGINL